MLAVVCSSMLQSYTNGAVHDPVSTVTCAAAAVGPTRSHCHAEFSALVMHGVQGSPANSPTLPVQDELSDQLS
jgi:hypothetical protein